MIESMLCLLPFHPVVARRNGSTTRFPSSSACNGATASSRVTTTSTATSCATAMLYAEWKTRGAPRTVARGPADRGAAAARRTLDFACTWRPTAPGPAGCASTASGTRTSWNLRRDYPRRNGSPEWFTVESGRSYVVRDLDTGRTACTTGRRWPTDFLSHARARATAATLDRAEQRLACWWRRAGLFLAPRTARTQCWAAVGPVARLRRPGSAERSHARRRADGDRARRAPRRARCLLPGRG